MKQVSYEVYPGDQVTDAMLDDAAKLFSENYGIWGPKSHKPGTKRPPPSIPPFGDPNHIVSPKENTSCSIHADYASKSSPIHQHAASSE